MQSCFSHVLLFASLCTVTHQASLSMGFPRQEYCSGLLFPSPGDLLNPGIKPRSRALQADSLLSEPPRKLVRNRNVIQFSIIIHEGKFAGNFWENRTAVL